MLRGRRVLLAVTGGVAAYKSAYLARLLVEAGARCRVVMTSAATEFIGAQTFAAITGRHPHTSLFAEAGPVSPHTELARWAEVIIVYPTTSATIAKLATGISSDLVSATVIASEKPLLIAPAMHTEMWGRPSTQRNISTLVEDGAVVIGPFEGPLAGGDEGVGRVAEPDEVVAVLKGSLKPADDAAHVLITAGGTREAIDPVRYIGNRSSGKTGHALATEAAARGLVVTLITTSSLPVGDGIDAQRVESAQEMFEAVDAIEPDIAIMAAAVADFRPVGVVDDKLSRSADLPAIELESTPDILASVVARGSVRYVIGFAAETGEIDRAVRKAKKKGVDLMVYNNVAEPDAGFGTDTNRVSLIDRNGNVEELDLMSKRDVAAVILDRALFRPDG